MGRVLGSIAGTIVLLGVAAVGCGSDEGGDTGSNDAAATTDESSNAEPETPVDSTVDGTDEPAATAPEDTDAADPVAPSSDSGSATLVVGDTTYEFDNFVCAFGYDNTQSETFSFSSNFIGEVDGVRVQMQLDVEDPTGGDQLTGDAVTQRIYVDDIEDFENPAISLSSSQLTATFDGDDITAEGTFWDAVNDPGRTTELPGTFTATCGAGSRR
jgi:hypothetical protein